MDSRWGSDGREEAGGEHLSGAARLSMRERLGSAAAALLILLTGAAPRSADAWTIRSTGQAPIAIDGNGATELSGIAHAGGAQYFAVSDDGGRVFPLTIDVDPASGQVTSASISGLLALTPGADLEAIVLLNGGTSLLVSDESGPAIRRHSLADGSFQESLSLPATFAAHRPNLSLESLALQPDGSALWTANEEALGVDGPIASFTDGTVVRLQRFDASFAATGQWAYVTDAIPGDFFAPGRDIERSGVSELIVLPNGELLVLERALGGETIFRSQLQLVSLTGASDTTSVAGLAMTSFVAAGKTLLWQEAFSTQNFEGAALGTRLHNGDYSLVLVSDNGGGLEQSLLALRVSSCDTLPRVGCRTPGASRLRLRSGGNRSQLSWSWRRGTVGDASLFGDPSTTSAYALCIYETAGGTARLVSSARVDPNNAWQSLRTGALRYRDRTATRDGITGITLRPGNGTARISVSGRGPQLRLRPSNGVDPLLRLDPSVIVQLVNQESPNDCFGATYSTAKGMTHNRFGGGF